MLDKYPTTATTQRTATPSTLRRTIYRMLETAQDSDAKSKAVDVVLIVLIAASVVAVILESIPAVEQNLVALGR